MRVAPSVRAGDQGTVPFCWVSELEALCPPPEWNCQGWKKYRPQKGKENINSVSYENSKKLEKLVQDGRIFKTGNASTLKMTQSFPLKYE